MIAERGHYLKMKGHETFKIAVRTLEESAKEALAANGYTVADVSLFIPHQANARIINAVAARLGIPADKVMVNLDRYGNTSAASIPLALDEAVQAGRIRNGDLLLMEAFGGGLTWGCTLVRW